jgi:hypothetical protein
MAFFTQQMAEDIAEYEGFFDGVQKIIPDNTELTALVYDGFNGIEEGKAVNICKIDLVITSEGEFKGQKYTYKPKIYDNDAGKRDLAMRNLQVIDAQAGYPMTDGRLDLTTDNIADCWVGKSEVRVKFGHTVLTENMDGTERDNPMEINFVRGLAYYREKMLPRASAQKAKQQQAQHQVPVDDGLDDEIIDF